MLLGALWIFWQQPRPVKMAAYIPAETLLYLEVNSLPQVLETITKTAAWRELAPQYGVKNNLENFGWLNQILANANLGSTETIVFGRAQIGVALMSVGAAETGENLKIRPQFAVVIETQSNRVKQFVETEVNDFARRQFGDVRIEKKEAVGAQWTIFRSRADERNLFAAVAGTTMIIGNDEAAVTACLDAKNGKRQSLADNEDLAQMRVNTTSETAVAFGFVTTSGVAQLSNVGAILFAGQLTEDARAMSLLAQALPPFVQKSVTAIGWTAREGRGNKIEDCYFVQMPADLTAKLREPLQENSKDALVLGALLPADLQSVTFYNLENAQFAWRGVISAMNSKLDFVSAAAFSQTANSLLEPYGVEKADQFLGATAGPIVTLQPLSDRDTTVAVVGAGDSGALQKALQIGGAKESETTNNYLWLGTKQDLEFCRAAREQNRTLSAHPIWLEFSDLPTGSRAALVRTLKRDEKTPTDFVKLFAKNKSIEKALPVGEIAPAWVWTISETRLIREGFERRTTSPFGLIGTLATSFADD